MPKSKQMVALGLWGAMVILMIAIVASGVWPSKRTATSAGTTSPIFPMSNSGAGGTSVDESPGGELLLDVPTFSLADQNEKSVSNADLRGHVWVGAFMFTECPGVCPMMSKQMARLQEAAGNADVKIVSFSLDPEHDTPAVRRAYLEKIKGDGSRWLYLAGDKQTAYDLAKKMNIAAMPAKGDVPIIHGQQVALVDREGKIRNYYDGTDPDSMKQLAADAAKLAAK